jgi:hypothetical protein
MYKTGIKKIPAGYTMLKLNFKYLPNTFTTKIREKLHRIPICMLRAIFYVFYRHCTIPGGYMLNLQNDKYDDGRRHPGVDKF